MYGKYKTASIVQGATNRQQKYGGNGGAAGVNGERVTIHEPLKDYNRASWENYRLALGTDRVDFSNWVDKVKHHFKAIET